MSEHTHSAEQSRSIDSGSVGYYGLPVIHGPHWKWLIIGYFYCGGISGSSAVIASIARLAGGKGSEPVARIATYVSAAALAPCPILLILDLGRPARFLNMLRGVRLTSVMSIGTWGLTLFGALTSLTLAAQALHDAEERLAISHPAAATNALRILAIPNALTGFFLAGYTGVLLSATAVPLWSKRPELLSPLFLASAMSSGAATIAATAAITNVGDQRSTDSLHSLEALAALAEATLFIAWLCSLGSTAKPLSEGSLGYVARNGIAIAGIAAPGVISAVSGTLPRRSRRAAAILASVLTLGGVLALRYVVVVGGRESAGDPQATFDMTG